MQLKRINSAIDRIGRNDINENFGILERTYGKTAIDAQTAKEQSIYAVETSDEAKQQAESVQAQFNQVVIAGDSSVEAAQARVSSDDTVYDTLKARLDGENAQVTQQLAHIGEQKANKQLVENVKEQTEQAIIDLETRKAEQSTVDALANIKLDVVTYNNEKSQFARLSDLANIASGTPLFASNLSGMTNTTRLYVNTTDGYIYAHNGTSFVSTGQLYQASGLDDKAVTVSKLADDVMFKVENTISFDFTKIGIQMPGLSNGATYSVFTRQLTIPNGSTGDSSYLRYFQVIEGAEKTKVRIYFKVKMSEALTSKASFTMNLAVVNNGTTHNNKRDAVHVMTALGDNVYLFYIDFTNTYLGDIEIRPYLQINTTDTSAKFMILEQVSYTLTPTEKNVQANDIVLQNVIDALTCQKNPIYTNQTTYLDVQMSVEDYDHLFLDVTQIYDTALKAFGYKNGVYETTPIPMLNLKTGNTFNSASTVGKYRIDTSQYERVKFSNYQSSVNAPISMTAFWQQSSPLAPTKNRINTNLAFTGKPTATKIPNMLPQCIKNDVIYFINTALKTQLRKSTDWGVNTTLVYTFESEIKRVQVLDNGNCLVLLTDGKLFVSTNNMTTFAQIHDFGTKPPHALFGIHEYKQYVLLTEYATVSSGSAGTKVYLSTDYGATIHEIFDLNDWGLSSGYHTHSAVYDPYEKLIWVCVGDGMNNNMIFYSANLGTTWYKAADFGNAPTQATIIIPLRDCVLFGSDARLVNVIRYNRPQSGTPVGQKLDFETAIIFEESWGKATSTEVPIASTPCIDYKNSVAYFGYAIIGNADNGSETGKLKYGEIFATNGYSFDEIYKEGAIVGDGVFGVWADFEKSNKVVARLVDSRENLVLFDVQDVWI